MNKRLFITLLALLPLLAVQAQITAYDLFICGTQVTSQNASNILGDGAFSYNASTNMLTVQKDVSVENKNIIVNRIDGLTLNIARDVAFESYGNQLMVYNETDCSMTVKGDGKLTMSNAEGMAGCFYIQGDATLTIDNMEIEAQGQNIFWGNKSSEKLVLKNSYIHAKCAGGGFGAIFELGGGITFEDCHISIPEDGYVDMTRFMGIVNQDGSIAREVLIETGEAIKTYDLTVLGERVTSLNADDILGDGSFSYDPENKVLTISGDGSYNGTCVYSSIEGLTINVTQDVTLQASLTGLHIEEDATLTGAGKLTIKSESDCCIYAVGATITIDNMNIEVDGKWGIAGYPANEYLIVKGSNIHAISTDGAVCDFNSITLEDCIIIQPVGGAIDNGNVVDSEGNVAKEATIAIGVVEDYPIKVCGTQVTSANASDVLGDGVFSYDAATQTLTVSGDCTTYNAGNIIDSDIDGLVINVATDSKLWLAEGGASSLKVLSLYGNTTIKGNGELSISAMDYGYGIYTNSSLTIEDMKLSLEAHYSCIYLFYGHNYSDTQLTIRNSRVFAYSEDDHDPAFKVEGSLVLEGCYVSRPSGGYVYGSTIVDSYGNPSRDLTISIGDNPNPVVPYELVICGKRVTNRNASDVLGDGVFSYDAETQTLTVSGDCTYERENNIINSGIEGLVIDVTANSELKTTALYNADVMYLAKNTTIKGDGKLTIVSESLGGLYFTSSSSVTIEDMNIEANCFYECFISSSGYASKGDLTIHNSTIHAQTQSDNRKAFSCSGGIVLEGCHITLPDGGYVNENTIMDSLSNPAKEVTIEPGDDPNPAQLYDLFICGNQVTNRNASDVLGDGAFSYDAENKVLTVSGDASTYEEYIIYNKATDGCEGIDGLTIDFQKDVKFTTTGREGTYIQSYGCIRLESNTTFKGEGTLTIESSGFGLTSHKSLTIEGMTIEANCSHDGFVGYYSNPSPIRIISSDIHVKAGANYVAFFSFSEFNLEGCQIIQPEGAYLDVNNYNSIVDSEGNFATEVTIGVVKYDLYVCGTQVTSNNAEDILGDRGFSYDAATKTLTVSRSVNIGFEAPIINNEGIDGLTINVTNDVTFKTEHLYVWPIRINANTTVTGKGKLTVKAKKEAGFIVRNRSTLTFDDVRVETEGEYGGVSGVETEYLVVRNAVLHAISTSTSNPAIRRFVSLTLDGVKITLPTNGQFRATGSVNSQMVVDADGNMAREVIIEPVPEEGQLMICRKLVTDDNASDVLEDGVFRFNASSKTLYINGDCTYDGTIIDSRLSSLTIVSEGVSSLHSLESETIKGYNLTFKNSYPTKVVSDNDAAIRLLFKMPTIPVESMQTEIEGHLTIDGCEMEIEGKNYGLYSDVSWDMISDGVLQPQGYYNLYLYTYLTIVNSELIVRGNEAAIYHFTEMNCSGYPVFKPSAGEYHTGYLGNIIDPTEFYYQDQTDPNNPKPATEVIIGDEITAIHDIDANVDTNYSNAVRYNLSGQRVGRDYRGIVIENGKKVLMK